LLRVTKIRLLITLVVLRGDPLAVALTAAAPWRQWADEKQTARPHGRSSSSSVSSRFTRQSRHTPSPRPLANVFVPRALKPAACGLT